MLHNLNDIIHDSTHRIYTIFQILFNFKICIIILNWTCQISNYNKISKKNELFFPKILILIYFLLYYATLIIINYIKLKKKYCFFVNSNSFRLRSINILPSVLRPTIKHILNLFGGHKNHGCPRFMFFQIMIYYTR